MSEKKYTLREIEDLIKKDTELHKNLLKSIRKSIIAFTKDHPESNLNNSNCWPSIAKRVCGQMATCIHNEWQRNNKENN